jgi:hypothetical protein
MANIIFLTIFIFIFAVLGFYIFRNQWVYRKSIEALGNGTYDELPDYDYMFKKVFIWDIEKFKAK